jgi:hypothetical protein
MPILSMCSPLLAKPLKRLALAWCVGEFGQMRKRLCRRHRAPPEILIMEGADRHIALPESATKLKLLTNRLRTGNVCFDFNLLPAPAILRAFAFAGPCGPAE